jgi:hypothetical protein
MARMITRMSPSDIVVSPLVEQNNDCSLLC